MTYYKDNDKSNTNNCNKTNRVLVHCKEGVSRSASIVISYLMKSRNMKLNETLEYVKNRREVVDPNSGFKEQLKEFEKNGYTVKPKQHWENVIYAVHVRTSLINSR